MYMKKFFCLLCFAIALPAMAQTDNSQHNFEVSKQLEIFNSLYKELDLYYVDTLNAKENVDNAINYMLGVLDPYTVYYAEENSDELRQMTTGKYAGIGSLISFRTSAKRCIIAQPYENMPAAEAGLQAGDVILAQDGKDYGEAEEGKENDYTNRVSASLRGEPGTSFELTVRRYGVEKPITLRLTRRTINLPNVILAKMVDDEVGYVLLDGYKEQTVRDLRRAIVELKQQGMKSLVLDLRGNPGGLLEQAAEMVNLFLPKGLEVASLKGKSEQTANVYRTAAEPLDTDMPVAVLTSYSTASAAEVTAGALQDYDRAVVVGQKTYGKGLVQQPRSLPYNTIVKITTAKYYIPSGRCIQAYKYKDGLPQHLPDSLSKEFKTRGGRTVRDAGGITPDVEVKPDSLPTLLTYLDADDALYDWCAAYRKAHPAIAEPETFSLSDAEYADLKAFLKERNFSYDTRSKAALDLLRQIAKSEGYADVTQEEFAALEAKLAHNQVYDFEKWEPEIRELVEGRLVEMYYYDRGASAYALRHDPELQAALRVLKSPTEYRRILGK